MGKRLCEKLSPRYYGPFELVSKVGAVAYKLNLPPKASIHPVFHVSQLRKAIGTSQPVSSLPPQLAAPRDLVLEPEAILGIRPSSDGKGEDQKF